VQYLTRDLFAIAKFLVMSSIAFAVLSLNATVTIRDIFTHATLR